MAQALKSTFAEKNSEGLPPGGWWPCEHSAWAPPEDITVSQWAEKYRVLPKQAAFPGSWRNNRGPYAVGVMDAFNDPRVEQITIMASIQSMKTESAYNMLGYAICQDPAPALVIMPTQKTLKKANKRLRQMLFASPELMKHVTPDPDDLKFESFSLDRMEVYFGTAGSEADLQFVEARILILDETDLYPPGAIKMAVDRSTTYWNRKIVKLSRPTVPEGHINQEYQRSDQRKFWVPCPVCGHYQVLSFWQVKHAGEKLGEWPKDEVEFHGKKVSHRYPEYIKEKRVARYECVHCQAELDDKDKPGMLARGKWVPEGHPFDPATGEMPPVPQVSHVGFWWNVLYSPFKNFSEVAAEFFESRQKDDLRNFMTQWLAEPWQDIVRERSSSYLQHLFSERPPLEVPENTLGLTAGIDCQKRGFWVAFWAHQWREGGFIHHHCIRYGFVDDFDELEIWLFQDAYRRADGVVYPVHLGAIDTGGGEGEPGEATQTDQVYDWLRRGRGRGRIFGVKGASRVLPGGKRAYFSHLEKRGLGIWILDTHAFKEALWARVQDGRIHFHREPEVDFGNPAQTPAIARHLTAEVKLRDAKGREVWTQRGSQPNHLLDATIYALAMAEDEIGKIRRLAIPPPPTKEDRKTETPLNPFTGKRQGEWLRR